ncbi:NADH dehydrogenase [Acidisarcina polymorpha]|uniref:NADH:ubiquinone reductase (non-electrogenic) n=1 Tax=Acidisarcina polymorpha TaxID=2211140 RepID=A0A2Z5G759_9BACT|nr:NAD(P)/FAD-dependent oxidoreductase [Acidisarcina polymorpha]AXC14800.1 NADH dehydrogenase [Acidisarcina polymorpha]
MSSLSGQNAGSGKHVVIVGGGFAGLNCARHLGSKPGVRVTLLDKNNYQQFQPLLYQVATAILASGNIAFNLRGVLHNYPNVEVRMTEVTSIDPHTRTVETAEGQHYQGDCLVLAAGAQANFFGTPGAEEHSYPLYSLRDAQQLRSRILAMLESADRDPALIDKGALNFVIVGGGATGTEMAGAFGDMLLTALKLDPGRRSYKNLGGDGRIAKIFLVDGGDAVLKAFSPKNQAYAGRMLEKRRVQLHLKTRVKEVGDGYVVLSDGTKILTHTVIWAGGLKAVDLSGKLGIMPGKGGRLDVAPDLTVPGLDGVYALGDFANILGKDGKPLPQLASVAQQSGNWCAKNILHDVAGRPREAFRYLDKGIMAMIGQNSAVAEVGGGKIAFRGLIGFMAWLAVHAVLLTSFQARIEAFVAWAWTFIGGARGDALIDRPEELKIDWTAGKARGSGVD